MIVSLGVSRTQEPRQIDVKVQIETCDPELEEKVKALGFESVSSYFEAYLRVYGYDMIEDDHIEFMAHNPHVVPYIQELLANE